MHTYICADMQRPAGRRPAVWPAAGNPRFSAPIRWRSGGRRGSPGPGSVQYTIDHN